MDDKSLKSLGSLVTRDGLRADLMKAMCIGDMCKMKERVDAVLRRYGMSDEQIALFATFPLCVIADFLNRGPRVKRLKPVRPLFPSQPQRVSQREYLCRTHNYGKIELRGEKMATKMTVHNLMEVKALIKEAFAKGNEEEFNRTVWFTHSGEFLCSSLIDHTDFELILADKSSVTVEVWA